MTEAGVALLIADLAGSTSMYELLGNEIASQQIGECLALLVAAAEGHSGRVVKTLGDGVLCVFPAVPDAAAAATTMRDAMAARGFRLRAAVHAGPVITAADDDVFGDAVNTVSRLCDKAAGDEVLFSGTARTELPAELRAQLRELPPLPLRGKRDVVAVFALAPRKAGANTVEASLAGEPQRNELVLAFGDHELPLADRDHLTLGRDPGCDLVVAETRASRVHAQIARIGDNFYLADTSSNGTWFAPDGQPATRLHRERALLVGRGTIHCGANPAAATAPPVRYRIELPDA